MDILSQRSNGVSIMNADQHTFGQGVHSEAPEWLSALMDGDIANAELNALLDAPNTELHAQWHAYHAVGEALRAERPLPSSRAPQDFLAGVMAGVGEVDHAPRQLPTPVELSHVRGPAANDAVMRWKALAGVASLAAVMAVGWGVLRVEGAPFAQTETLASASSPLTVAALPVPAGEAAGVVVVNTEQGKIIRDPRLEQLLAAHRQYGGASVLQMPAGFLRNATYESAPQR